MSAKTFEKYSQMNHATLQRVMVQIKRKINSSDSVDEAKEKSAGVSFSFSCSFLKLK